MEYTVLSQSSSGGLFANPLFMILFYVVILGGLWFLLMRPQKKEQKRIQAMIADMEVGDTVLTTSGFYGVVIDITEEDVIVEFGNNKNCRIPMQKAAIMQVEKPGAETK
ncbi:preprotein translocase subunit YajC [Drancourtella sp. An210]|nr:MULTISPECIES: preprotein translocase subunit YajC [Sellimonas]OUP02832.1 preprotein translocase subunit YajC [Drancourtella sp. An210]OUP64976.1 preprotein translocase subunit YajC [Drancourtella sp. An177]